MHSHHPQPRILAASMPVLLQNYQTPSSTPSSLTLERTNGALVPEHNGLYIPLKAPCYHRDMFKSSCEIDQNDFIRFLIDVYKSARRRLHSPEFALTESDHAKGIHTVDQKRESLCHAFDCIEVATTQRLGASAPLITLILKASV